MGVRSRTSSSEIDATGRPGVVRVLILVVAVALGAIGEWVAASMLLGGVVFDLAMSAATERAPTPTRRRLVQSVRIGVVVVLVGGVLIADLVLVFDLDALGAASIAAATAIAAIVGYVVLCTARIGRAQEKATELLAPEELAVTLMGVRAPALIWHGNGMLLAAGAQTLVGVDVPWGSPCCLFRLSKDDIQTFDVQRRCWTSRIAVRASGISLSLTTSKTEAENLAAHLNPAINTAQPPQRDRP